jgi:adenylosuccinate synthase
LEEKNFFFKNYYKVDGYSETNLLEDYLNYGEALRPYVADTIRLINQEVDAKKRVLFEGAQGTFLDVDFGTYPFVTASHPTAGGACTGTGVSPTKIEQILGVVKAYTTRVGAGPLPTEIPDGGEMLRTRGKEFGSTTGRPRRCGWFDAVIVRRAHLINNFKSMAITKLDVLSGIPTINICTGYKVNGKTQQDLPSSLEEIQAIEPIYLELPGWNEDISGCKKIQNFPKNARKYLEKIEELVGVEISIISIGEDRKQTILLRRFL